MRSDELLRSLSIWVLKTPQDGWLLSGQPVALSDCAYSEKNFFSYQSEPFLLQLLPVVFCPAAMHVCGVWVHLQTLKDCRSVPLKPTLLQLNNPISLTLSSQGKIFSSQLSWWPFAELGLVYPYLSCTERLKISHSIPNV